MSTRRGFTMITTLWVMTVAGVMAAAAALSGRLTVETTRNRVLLERSFWLASGCAARAQASIDEELARATSFESAADTWRVLGRLLASRLTSADSQCVVTLEAAGTRIDVNDAPDELLINLLRILGYGEAAPSMVDVLEDWRDTDDVARPSGAERDWYVAQRRFPPRNGDLPDIRELTRIRGFENRAMFNGVLTVEQGRISLATAPATVLASVPGFTRETAERIVDLQASGNPPRDVMSIVGLVSAPSAEAIIARYADIVRLTTPDPDAWILTVRASTSAPANSVTLSRRLVRSGKRSVVVATRSEL